MVLGFHSGSYLEVYWNIILRYQEPIGVMSWKLSWHVLYGRDLCKTEVAFPFVVEFS